jgi:ribosome-binding protein aMBF1 (putative translation factor)
MPNHKVRFCLTPNICTPEDPSCAVCKQVAYEKKYQSKPEVKEKTRERQAMYRKTRKKHKKTGSCSICGQNTKTHWHHTDPPNPNAVIEVCVSCHAAIERGKSEARRAMRRSLGL